MFKYSLCSGLRGRLEELCAHCDVPDWVQFGDRKRAKAWLKHPGKVRNWELNFRVCQNLVYMCHFQIKKTRFSLVGVWLLLVRLVLKEAVLPVCSSPNNLCGSSFHQIGTIRQQTIASKPTIKSLLKPCFSILCSFVRMLRRPASFGGFRTPSKSIQVRFIHQNAAFEDESSTSSFFLYRAAVDR